MHHDHSLRYLVWKPVARSGACSLVCSRAEEQSQHLYRLICSLDPPSRPTSTGQVRLADCRRLESSTRCRERILLNVPRGLEQLGQSNASQVAESPHDWRRWLQNGLGRISPIDFRVNRRQPENRRIWGRTVSPTTRAAASSGVGCSAEVAERPRYMASSNPPAGQTETQSPQPVHDESPIG